MKDTSICIHQLIEYISFELNCFFFLFLSFFLSLSLFLSFQFLCFPFEILLEEDINKHTYKQVYSLSLSLSLSQAAIPFLCV